MSDYFSEMADHFKRMVQEVKSLRAENAGLRKCIEDAQSILSKRGGTVFQLPLKKTNAKKPYLVERFANIRNELAQKYGIKPGDVKKLKNRRIAYNANHQTDLTLDQYVEKVNSGEIRINKPTSGIGPDTEKAKKGKMPQMQKTEFDLDQEKAAKERAASQESYGIFCADRVSKKLPPIPFNQWKRDQDNFKKSGLG